MGWSPWKSHRFWIDCLASFRAIGSTSEFWWRKFALRDSIEQVSGLNMAYDMKWTWAYDGLWCILAYGWVIWGNPCRQMMGRWDNQASKAVHRVWKTEVPCLASPQELRKVSRWFVFHQGPVMTFVNLFQQICFENITTHYDETSLMPEIAFLHNLWFWCSFPIKYSEDGYPAMMELADGTKVARGDKDWQYWKFAWRQQHFTGDASGGNGFAWFWVQTKVEGLFPNLREQFQTTMTSNDSAGQWKKRLAGWLALILILAGFALNLGTFYYLYILFIDMSESSVWVKPDVQVQPHHGHYAHRPLAYDTLPSCQRHGHSCQEDAIPKSSIEAVVVCLYIWIHFCQPAGGDFPKVRNYM